MVEKTADTDDELAVLKKDLADKGLNHRLDHSLVKAQLEMYDFLVGRERPLLCKR